MKTLLHLVVYMLFHAVLSGQNIMISNQSNPNEPAIMIDPKNPNVLIAGANLNNYFISLDTGNTWTKHTLSSTFGVWGDPVISVDTAGNFYFFHLSNPSSGSFIDRIVCQKSSNKGQTWTNGSFTGLNGTKAQDKQWCAIDRTNNKMYLTWTQFDKYASSDPTHKSVILFSKSSDNGTSWTAPTKISIATGDCKDDDNTVEGAVPAVGPNGEIYVSWAGPNGIVFNKSSDQGTTWLTNEIPVNPMPGGWNYAIPGIDRCNGLPITVCDLSNGPNRGTIYINWSDQRNGTSNTDIWLAKSTDGGQTWANALKVNDDVSNKHQFMSWMTIDQKSGYLYFVFYDRRNYSDNSTDVYVAVSMDGGNTFINRKISSSPFIPTNGIFFGDYTNIIAHNGIIRPIWTRLHSGQLSIWTDLTKLSSIVSTQENAQITNNNMDFENYPNPADNFTYVSFKLHKESKVKLSVYSILGNEIHKVIVSEIRGYGKYVERINLKELNIDSGNYLLKLEIDGQQQLSKLIVIN